MNFTVAEVAKIMNVNGKTIKDWSFHFAEHLSSTVNPPNGQQRLYTIEDIRVFAYVLLYWEDDPDIEYIKYGLNSREYFDIEPINNSISAHFSRTD